MTTRSEGFKEPAAVRHHRRPVSAIVQAEAQAAQTALQFIEKVGFQRDPNAPSQSALDAGKLRMVEFGSPSRTRTGTRRRFTARIPLLALFPIPGMRVSLAKIAFSAKITDVFTETTSSQPGRRGRGRWAVR